MTPQPTYYVQHPDGSISEAKPQPVRLPDGEGDPMGQSWQARYLYERRRADELARKCAELQHADSQAKGWKESCGRVSEDLATAHKRIEEVRETSNRHLTQLRKLTVELGDAKASSDLHRARADRAELDLIEARRRLDVLAQEIKAPLYVVASAPVFEEALGPTTGSLRHAPPEVKEPHAESMHQLIKEVRVLRSHVAILGEVLAGTSLDANLLHELYRATKGPGALADQRAFSAFHEGVDAARKHLFELAVSMVNRGVLPAHELPGQNERVLVAMLGAYVGKLGGVEGRHSRLVEAIREVVGEIKASPGDFSPNAFRRALQHILDSAQPGATVGGATPTKE